MFSVRFSGRTQSKETHRSLSSWRTESISKVKDKWKSHVMLTSRQWYLSWNSITIKGHQPKIKLNELPPKYGNGVSCKALSSGLLLLSCATEILIGFIFPIMKFQIVLKRKTWIPSQHEQITTRFLPLLGLVTRVKTDLTNQSCDVHVSFPKFSRQLYSQPERYLRERSVLVLFKQIINAYLGAEATVWIPPLEPRSPSSISCLEKNTQLGIDCKPIMQSHY